MLCALVVFSSVPVTPIGSLYTLQASAADVSELQKVYDTVPAKDSWDSYVDTTDLKRCYDVATLLLADPSTASQDMVDEYTLALQEALSALKWHTMGLTLDKKEITAAHVGKTYTLVATLTPADAGDEIFWSTSNASAVSVENNSEGEALLTVKAHSETPVTITANSNGYKDTCTVTTVNVVSGLTLSNTSLNLYPSEKATLKVTAVGADSLNAPTGTLIYTWDSDDEEVATVSDTGVVTAKGAGSCNVTVTVTDSYGYTKTAVCTVKVNDITLIQSLTPLTSTTSSYIYLTANETTSFKVGILPATATIKTLSWKSSDTSVATVSNASVSSSTASVKITALSPGKTKITYSATDGSGLSGYFYVEVRPLITSLSLGETFKVIAPTAVGEAITAKILPENAGNQALLWTTSDSEICTVSATGVLYPKKSGVCTITATTTDGTEISKSCTVRVAEATSSIRLSRTSLNLSAGDKYTLTATVTSSDGSTYNDVKWKSGDTSVATISNTGVITAKGPGSVVITATAYDNTAKRAVCVLTVDQPVTGVTLPATLNVSLGGSKTLTPTITPSNATNKEVTWTSSNTSVATVSSSGKISGLKTGTTNITCKTQDGSYSATCVVTVVISATAIKLNKTSASLNSGDTLALSVTFTPTNTTNKNVTWTSSNEEIATVSSKGVVTAKAGGTCTITAKSHSGSRTATCTVTVKQEVSGVELSTEAFSIYTSGTKTIKATVIPSTASNKSVKWTSSNTNVATVSSSGKVTGINPGVCTITATTVDGGYKSTCTVTVYKKVNVTGLKLDSTSLTMEKGTSTTILATITPSNASDKTITWSSTDTSVATVTSKGVVTAKATGTTVITAITKDGNFLQQCKVTVEQSVTGVKLNLSETKIAVGKTKTLKATISPSDATNKKVTWSSSNKEVATVSSSGVVTAVKKGAAVITATTKDGSYTATCTVDVYVGVSSVTLNSEKVKLPKGETTVLSATVKPSDAENKNIVWSTSDKSVATVSQTGLVTGKKKGTVTITVTTEEGSKKDSCIVEVVQLVTKITADYSKLTLETGKSKTLSVSVSPSTASDKTVKFSSSNKKVATVSSKGVVKAVGPGTAVITIKSADGNAKTTCNVTVTQPVTGLKVSPSKANVKIGAMLALTPVFTPENATNQKVSWKSSDTSVATVDSNGVVKGIKKGTAKITCTSASGGFTATATITVIKPVKSVSLSKESMKLIVGRASTLTATISPSSASIKTVTWSSSNNDVATVDSSGKVSAKAPGYAKITVKTKDGGKTDVCEVLVIQPVTGVKISKTSATLEKGKTLTLKATVKPSNASDLAVKWKSSDTSVAKVSSKGVVTGVDSGTAKITVTTNDGSFKATCTVTVKRYVTGVKLNVAEKKIYLGDTYKLKATVSPSDATTKTVTWKSGDTSIATVSSNGTITPVKPGTVKITVTTKDGSFKDSCTVTVMRAVKTITLNKTGLSLNVDETATLKATLSPSNATDKTVEWKSSDTSVATVTSKGVVKGLKRGTATITATTENGLKKTCKVTVYQPVTGVELSESELTVYAGDKTTLVATVLPLTANTNDVKWSVSRDYVLSVTSNGVVTAVGPGRASVTVKTKEGGYTAKCIFNVLQHVEQIKFAQDEIIIKQGDAADLSVEILPENASDKTFTLVSSNEDVVTVDQNGRLVSVGLGEATITATSNENNKTATCTVKVVKTAEGVELSEQARTIFVGESFVLSATVLPLEAYYRTVKWSTSDESVATVNENGVVTAVKSGTATITATTDDGSFTADCVVTTLQKATGIEMSETEKRVLVGENFSLTATVLPLDCYNKNVAWTSDKEDIAKVDETGKVTTFAPGVAVITAKSEDGSFTVSCTVTVHQNVTDLQLDTQTLKLYKNEKHKINAVVIPFNASDPSLTWHSNDEAVAKVDENGLVTAIGKGRAVITARSNDNQNIVRSCTFECILTVEDVVIEKDEYFIVEGGSVNLNAYAIPIDAEDTTLIYKSDDNAVAKVDENGVVTAVSKGEAVITVTSVAQPTIKKQITINVTRAVTGVELSENALTINKGETAALTATVTPNSANYKDIVWSSKDETVATVKDGVITAIAGGQTQIVVTTVDGSFTDECTVTVIELPESVVFSDIKYYVGVGKTNTLKVTVLPETANDKSVTFESDNDKVVTVDNKGVITGVKRGIANITVRTVSGNAYNVVTVEVIQAPEKITLRNEKDFLFVGESTELIYEVLPEDTTDKSLVWSSSNEDVLTVDESGKITAVGAGTAEVTAKSAVVDASCKINVEVRQQANEITLDISEKTIEKGESFNLTATVLPENTYDKTVSYHSSNNEVLEVSAEGVVTAVGVGSAIITAKSSNETVYAQCVVKVIRYIDEITLSESELTIGKGQTHQFTVSVLPEDATETELIWTSSDETVATVDESGKLTALKGGFTTIKATTVKEEIFAECRVTVDVRSESVALTPEKTTIYAGETVTLIPTVLPEDTTDKTVIWSSADEEIAKVEDGVVTGVDAGTVKITAKMADGDIFAVCEITVLKHVEGVAFENNKAVAFVGRPLAISATVLPENASNKKLLWYSSDEKVATVSGGTVTPLRQGTTIITAVSEDGAFSDFVIVTVKQGITSITLDITETMLNKNQTITLTSTVLPENANDKTVIWSTSDDTIAEVADGVVTAKDKAGEVRITATSVDNSSVFAECKITVKQEVTEIEISETQKGLRVGEQFTLTANALPENANNKDIEWSTSDDAVATVVEGNVSALKPGTAIITATNKDSGASAICVVKVYLELESFELEELYIECGQTKKVSIVAVPAEHDEEFNFISSDEEIFTVDENGNVTAKDKAGNATLTVTSLVSGKTTSIEIEVVKRVESITIDTAVPDYAIFVGDSLQLEYTVTPSDATNTKVIFSTSNVEIANVTEDGYVTFKGEGEVTITVTTLDKSLEAEITFNVKADPNSNL